VQPKQNQRIQFSYLQLSNQTPLIDSVRIDQKKSTATNAMHISNEIMPQQNL
jgi:hypothetical protein